MKVFDCQTFLCWGMKVCFEGLGHMIEMPMYGKKPIKIFSFRTDLKLSE